MNLEERKLRLIQFVSELEDETFFDYIESVIESSGERFGVQLPEIQEEKMDKTVDYRNDGDNLLARFYAVTSDFDDEETIEQILETEFTEDEQFRILLLLRSEDIKKHPEQMIDGDTFIANLRKRNQERRNKLQNK